VNQVTALGKHPRYSASGATSNIGSSGMSARRNLSDDAWFAATAALVLVAIFLATILVAAVELRWSHGVLDTAAHRHASHHRVHAGRAD
jgi:hypothetical protein